MHIMWFSRLIKTFRLPQGTFISGNVCSVAVAAGLCGQTAFNISPSIKELYIINDLNVRKYSHIKSRRVQTCCDTLNHRHSSSSWIKDQSVTRVIMWGIPLNDAAFLQAGKLHYQTSVWRNAVKNKKSRM